MLAVKKADWFYRLALIVVMFHFYAGPFIHSLKLTKISYGVGKYVFYSTLILETLLFSCSFIFGRRQKNEKLDIIEYTLLFSIFWAISWTIYHVGSMEDIIGNFLRIILSFTCYHTTKRYLNTSSFLKFEKLFPKLGLFGVGIAVVFIYTFLILGRHVYIGLSTDPALPAFAQWITMTGNRFSYLSPILIVMGGKRGLILAMFLSVLFYHYFFGSKKKLFKIVSIGGLVIGLGMITLSLGDLIKIVNVLPRPVYSRITPFLKDNTDDVSLRDATAGRNNEVEGVFALWKHDPSIMVTGMGFGAWFVETTGVVDSSVHISPFALAHIFGIPLALILLTVVFMQPLLAVRRFSKNKDLQSIFWVVLCVSSLVETFSIFVFFQNPIIWISLARISQAYLSKEHELSHNLV